MSSDPVLDLDALIAPIPGDNPNGEPLPDALRMELDTHRREAVPGDDTTSHWKADWPKVIRITTDMLKKTGKDMHAASRLIEASTKLHGAAGLRDGLRLLQRLITECWDQLHPMPEDGDTTDVRESPIVWLNDAGKGARFPQTILSMPLFRVGPDSFNAIGIRSKDGRAAFDEAITTAPAKSLEALRPIHGDLLEARQAVKDMAEAWNERRIDKDSAPDYASLDTSGNIGSAIGACIAMVEEIGRKRNFPLVPPEPGADGGTGGESDSGDSGDVVSTAPSGNREGLYRQLEQIAGALRRVEPHSPIPYILERCVKLGALPFPELMRAIIRENATLDELDRLIGVEKTE